MSDIGSQYPVPLNQAKETQSTKLKWIQSQKQERISRIVHLKQAIEDLLKGKIPEIERQVMFAEQELKNLTELEHLETNSIDTIDVK